MDKEQIIKIFKNIGWFLLGVIINIGITIGLMFLIGWVMELFSIDWLHGGSPGGTLFTRGLVMLIIVVLFFAIEIFMIKTSLKKKKYLGVGLIASLILPLLLTGLCSLMIVGA